MMMTDILHLCKCTLTIVGPLVAATTSLSLYLKVLWWLQSHLFMAEILYQLRLAVYAMIYKVLYIQPVVVWDLWTINSSKSNKVLLILPRRSRTFHCITSITSQKSLPGTDPPDPLRTPDLLVPNFPLYRSRFPWMITTSKHTKQHVSNTTLDQKLAKNIGKRHLYALSAISSIFVQWLNWQQLPDILLYFKASLGPLDWGRCKR